MTLSKVNSKQLTYDVAETTVAIRPTNTATKVRWVNIMSAAEPKTLMKDEDWILAFIMRILRYQGCQLT